MTQELLLALCGFALVSSITPGPNNLMLMASGTNFGFMRTIPHMLGVSIGFVVMTVLVGLGLAQVFVAYPIAYTALKGGSVIYLIYLSWKIATATPPGSDHPNAQANAKPFTFLQACLFQWVNPKAWTMSLMSVTAYVPSEDPISGLVIVAVVFGLINLPTVSLWAYAGMQLRQFLQDPVKLRIFNIVAAVTLLASLYPVITHDLLAHPALQAK
ncbi:cysteine/O-acetylserine efflux protein [Candidatus Phycosocius bacilliformis]|uniref:Cysteine/O-acetylserine efflux protein n=1 Tax=Candidatus Phycosocius bacilliformis TaxID=1445552 RepID=A0A2P2E6N5_9PROT|nr:LysE family translocator [Candidatus Phycosocius bacilliformis]GBF56731.1 cysteine/O-acetylserine efflux protein [Candidatus Phycosocius bacilliformis]